MKKIIYDSWEYDKKEVVLMFGREEVDRIDIDLIVEEWLLNHKAHYKTG